MDPTSIPVEAIATANKAQESRDQVGPKKTARGASSGEDTTPATTLMSVASTTNK